MTIQKCIQKCDDVKWWFIHRFGYRYDRVQCLDRPGYADVDERMENAMINLLFYYVEVEQNGDLDRLKQSGCGDEEVARLYEFFKYELPPDWKQHWDGTDERVTEELINLVRIRQVMWT